MGKTIVLAGAGHAHLYTISKIKKLKGKTNNIKVISLDEYHYYSGMAPGFIQGIYEEDEIRFNIKSMVEKKEGQFIKGQVKLIDKTNKKLILENDEEINFDIASFNTGSRTRLLTSENLENFYNLKPIINLVKLKEKLIQHSDSEKISISIIGAGPSGVEMAFAVHEFCLKNFTNQPLIQIFSKHPPLDNYSRKIKHYVYQLLTKRGIKVVKKDVIGIKPELVQTNDKDYESQIIISASGVEPYEIFKNSKISAGPDNGLSVDKNLQSTDTKFIFGGGDNIFFREQPLDKVGVFAVKQGQIIFQNIKASVNQKELQEFKPQTKYLQIINTGNKTGILIYGKIVLTGGFPFKLKNFIDKRFMKKFKKFE